MHALSSSGKRRRKEDPRKSLKESAALLIEQAARNTTWRQKETINLIPSETTPSLPVRLLTIMDPSGRYAEHRDMKAFGGKEVFYYQGTKLIEEVETLLMEELRAFLGCSEVETRVISGQMANTAVFSGLMDYLNRLDRKSEPRRIRKVVNHHLGRGGHLSAQPMGALRDFHRHRSHHRETGRHPLSGVEGRSLSDRPRKNERAPRRASTRTDRPGKKHDPLQGTGKEIARTGLRNESTKPILHYDMAHVLGLIGPYFQEPFQEGADIVTGSTHKTFFGPQRGVIASNMSEETEYEELWEAIVRRVFPGSVSNHHLGTLLGLLMAAYEMNAFKSDYQKAVIVECQGLCPCVEGSRADRGGRSPAWIHRDPPGHRPGGLWKRTGHGRAAGREQHHRQLSERP